MRRAGANQNQKRRIHISIGERISIARTSVGMTREEVAKLLNVPYRTIGEWECDMRSPNFNSLEKLADVLGISIETLICGQAAEDTVKENPVPDEPPKYLNFLDEALRKTMEAKANLDIYMALNNADKNSEEAATLNNIYARLIDNIADILNLYVDAQT